MTRATQTKLRGFRDVPLIVLPSIEPTELVKPRRGETIRSFVKRTGWEARGMPIVCGRKTGSDFAPILRKDWGKRLKASDEIAFMAQPLGGGGGGGGGSRSVGALLATIAVIALATIVAGPGGFLAGAGFGASALAVTGAIIIAGGSFLISHFLMPKSGGTSTENNDPLSISLSGNKARPQQPIPVHYGKMKFNPDFSSPPWADFSGESQFFHGLYSLGVGEFTVHEIGIGGIPVWTESGGTSSDFPTFKYQIAGPDVPVTLFPVNVAVSPDVTGQAIEPINTPIGPFIINPPGSIGQELAIDLVWPGGSYTMDGANTRPASTGISVEYRMVNDVGVPFTTSWIPVFSNTYTIETKVALRKTERFSLPSAGRVQLRMTRTNALITGNGTNTVNWVGARLFLQGAGNTRPKVTQLAIQLQSDKSLTSANSQQIYVIATRKIPVWSGTSWVTQNSQNPIWAAVDMWHDPDYGGGQPYDKIDLPLLVTQAANADARGDTFNFRFVTETTVLDALTLILRTIVAQPVYVWDRFTVIRDEVRLLPRIQLTDFDIVRGSPSVVYIMQDDQTSDGTIVEYVEEQTWTRADVPSTANLNDLVHPARVQIEGVTNRRQATFVARYLAAVNRYRRKTLTLQIEAEGKLLRRGDLVAVQTEMPGTWGAAFRVEASNVSTRTLTLSGLAPWAASGNHYVRIKAADGSSFGPVKVAKGASDNIVILDQTDLTAVQNQQGTTLTAVLARSSLAEQPTLAFSPGQPREFLGLVTRMSSADAGQFSLDLVGDAPEVYTINDASVPALPDAPTLVIPQVPGQIAGLYASLTQRGITLALSASWQPDPASQTYTAQVSLDNGASWTTVYPAGFEPSFQVAGFGDRNVLLRIRGVSASGTVGPWTSSLITTPGLVLTTDALGIGLSPGAVTAASFASSIQPVGVVSSLPNPSGYTGVDVVYNTADGKLYHYESGAWAAGGGSDFSAITGQITSTQITPGAVTTPALAANAVTANELAANAVIAGKVAAGAISASAISVTTLSAIASNMGTLTAGLARDSAGKFIISFTDGYLLVSD